MTESGARAPETRGWSDVAAVLTVVAALIVAARQLRPLAENGAFLARTGEALVTMPHATWPRAVVWVAVAATVLLRWRAATLVAVWVAVGYEGLIALLNLNGQPAYAMPPEYLLWPGLLALTVAVLASVPAPAGRGLDLLGRRGRRLVLGAAAVTTLSAMAVPFTATYYGPPPPPDAIDPGSYISVEYQSQVAIAVGFGALAVGLILLVLALAGVVGPVRRRALSLLAAAVSGFVVAQAALSPYSEVLPALPRPVLLGSIALAAAVALAIGLLWTYLRERAAGPGPAITR